MKIFSVHVGGNEWLLNSKLVAVVQPLNNVAGRNAVITYNFPGVGLQNINVDEKVADVKAALGV